MKLMLKTLVFIAFILTAILLLQVVKEWDFQFDLQGKYVSPEGHVHWESTTEKNFFYFLLSLLLLSVSVIVYFRKIKI